MWSRSSQVSNAGTDIFMPKSKLPARYYGEPTQPSTAQVRMIHSIPGIRVSQEVSSVFNSYKLNYYCCHTGGRTFSQTGPTAVAKRTKTGLDSGS